MIYINLIFFVAWLEIPEKRALRQIAQADHVVHAIQRHGSAWRDLIQILDFIQFVLWWFFFKLEPRMANKKVEKIFISYFSGVACLYEYWIEHAIYLIHFARYLVVAARIEPDEFALIFQNKSDSSAIQFEKMIVV